VYVVSYTLVSFTVFPGIFFLDDIQTRVFMEKVAEDSFKFASHKHAQINTYKVDLVVDALYRIPETDPPQDAARKMSRHPARAHNGY
jgi:hypothetical protein